MSRVPFTLLVDPAQLAEVERLLAAVPGGVDRVLVTSVNSVSTTGRKEIVREMSRKLTLKQKRVREGTALRRATRQRLEAVITVSGRRIMLIEFSARQTRRGVTYQIERSQGRKLLPSGFIARGRAIRGTVGGGRPMPELVWKRAGKPRLPIFPKRGPSLPVAFERADELQTKVMGGMSDLLERRVWQKVNWLLERGPAGKAAS